MRIILCTLLQQLLLGRRLTVEQRFYLYQE